jgi:hypothetical protein
MVFITLKFKEMKKYITLFCFLSALFVACDKNQISTPTTVAEGARVKFIHASAGVPALDYYLNNIKLSPQLSTSLTDNGVLTTTNSGISYLSTFPSNEYAVVTPGNAGLKIVTSTPLPTLVSPQTVAFNTSLNTQTLNLANAKNYSVFTAGYPDNFETIVYEDEFNGTATDMAYVRFIHLSPNAPALDLALKYTPVGGVLTEITPFKNIAYKGNSGFVGVPAAVTSTGYNFQTKLAGTATTLGAMIPSATTLTNLTPGRYYTIYARGLNADYTVVSKGITLKAVARPSTAVTQPEIYYNPYGLTFYTNK